MSSVMGCACWLSAQGLLATLCASLILVNPLAKFAITLDPVGTAANTRLTAAVPGARPGAQCLAWRATCA